MRGWDLLIKSYPPVHAIRLILRFLNVVPAVQTSGIRGRFAEFLPHRVFVRTDEVTVTPSHKEFGLGGGAAPLRRSRGALDRADQR